MKRNGYFQRSPAFMVLLILMVFSIFTGSCKKSNGVGGPTQTLQQYLGSASQYTLFNKALKRASLDTLLGGVLPYTVFAVGDPDMIKSGYTSAGIDTIDIRQLRSTLQYQMVQGSFSTANLQLYQEVPLITADSNLTAYVEDNAYGFFYNGIPVIDVDSGMSNGIIQRMQKMATPPMGDLLTTIARTPSLSDYNFYIHYYSNNNTYLSNATASSPITTYLPNNTTYAALGLDNPSAIQSANSTINNYYYSNGVYFTSDFLGGSRINGYFAAFLLTPLVFPKDGSGIWPTDTYTGLAGPGTGYQFAQTNIVATNGVIHILQPYSY